MHVFLRTDRMVLHRFTAADVDLLVELDSDPEVIHFRPREGGSLDEAELGYRLRRSAWGKGHATEGSRVLICAGFTEHGVERDEHGDVEYALDRADWHDIDS